MHTHALSTCTHTHTHTHTYTHTYTHVHTCTHLDIIQAASANPITIGAVVLAPVTLAIGRRRSVMLTLPSVLPPADVFSTTMPLSSVVCMNTITNEALKCETLGAVCQCNSSRHCTI